MTRTTIALLTSAAMVIGSGATVIAQGKGSPKPHVTTVKTTTTKVSSPKTTSAPKMKTSGPSKTTTTKASKGPKPTTAKATKPAKSTPPSMKSAKADSKKTTKLARTDAKADNKSAKADAKAAKAETKAETKSAKKDSKTTDSTEEKSSTSTTTTTSGDDDTPVTLTKVQEKLQKNTKLAEKLESRLPQGTDLMEAAEGFRNLGQFVAAVNVSNNLGLDFDTLKTAMVDDGKSLGQAIQYVKRDVESPMTVAQRAETDAQRLIQETELQSTTTTTSNTVTKTKSKDKPKRTLRTQSGS